MFDGTSGITIRGTIPISIASWDDVTEVCLFACSFVRMLVVAVFSSFLLLLLLIIMIFIIMLIIMIMTIIIIIRRTLSFFHNHLLLFSPSSHVLIPYLFHPYIFLINALTGLDCIGVARIRLHLRPTLHAETSWAQANKKIKSHWLAHWSMHYFRYTYICMSVCMCLCIGVCMYVCMYWCMYVCISFLYENRDGCTCTFTYDVCKYDACIYVFDSYNPISSPVFWYAIFTCVGVWWFHDAPWVAVSRNQYLRSLHVCNTQYSKNFNSSYCCHVFVHCC